MNDYLLARAYSLLKESRFLSSMEMDAHVCEACDPGGEGAQLAYEHIRDIDEWMKTYREAGNDEH